MGAGDRIVCVGILCARVHVCVYTGISVCLSIPGHMDECVCLPTVILLSHTKEPIGSRRKMRT